MKTLHYLTALVICTGSSTRGEDLKLPDGTVFKNYSVLKQEVDGLKIEHADGVAKVKRHMLPAELAAKYKWDEKKIEEAKAAAEAAKAANAADAVADAKAAEATKKEEEESAALVKKLMEERRATAQQVGPCKVWLAFILPGSVDTAAGKRAGHLYYLTMENNSGKAIKGIVRGTVYLKTFGDTPDETTFSIQPGGTFEVSFGSLFGPTKDDTTLVFELEAANGRVERAQFFTTPALLAKELLAEKLSK